MNYLHQDTGEYPVTYAQIIERNSNSSIPTELSKEDAAHLGYDQVLPTNPPAFDAMTQGARETHPGQFSGEWIQRWEIYALSPEAVAANQQALIQTLTAGVQRHLDDFAKSRNYDGILSACTYASSTVPRFRADGQYCVDARDGTWAAMYQLMSDVQSGVKPMPTSMADVLPELPVLAWPH